MKTRSTRSSVVVESGNSCTQEEYEQKESRKRPLEYEENGTEAKRYNNSGNEPLLKLLVPSYAVGALIGKGGAVLKELKDTYGGNIRISAGKEHYPGTQERVVILTGEIDQIIDINNHVMEKVQDPGREPTMKNILIDGDRAQKVKIVLTNEAAGLLIGRGGLTIKTIQEESKAKISIGMPDKASVQGERVLTMSGSFDERTEACRQIVKTLANEITNMSNTKLRYAGHVSNVGFNSMSAGYGGMAPSFNNRQQQQQHTRNQFSGNTMSTYHNSKNKLKAKVEVQLEIPNILVGPILGNQGSIIKVFVQRSGGARFKFSDKSVSENRTLTINGDIDQTRIAYSLVNQRVEQLVNKPKAQGL